MAVLAKLEINLMAYMNRIFTVNIYLDVSNIIVSHYSADRIIKCFVQYIHKKLLR